MKEASDKYQKELETLKKNVKKSEEYQRANINRFNAFFTFVFKTAIDSNEEAFLRTVGKPPLEFNTLEPYISRVLGEFSKQLPSIEVSSDPDAHDPISLQTIKVVEGNIRHAIDDANKNKFMASMLQDTMGGGFSAAKVWTDFKDSMSLEQVINIGRAYDPTMCGWDPYAKHPNKIDGDYCYEKYLFTKEDFKLRYPGVELEGITFYREEEAFNWFYNDNKEDILVLCDFYKRKKKRVKITKLSNGQVMAMSDYDKFVKKWNEEGNTDAAAIPVGKPRMTTLDTICRYTFIGDRILDYTETNYKNLPIIFCDGNSVMIREGDLGNGRHYQMTRPLVYHAKGIQKLKNFAGQTLACNIQNQVMSQFIIAKEAIPSEPDYQDAYTNPQIASTLVFNAFDENSPEKALPPPREINRIPSPPEVTNTFVMADQAMQNILGSYDASLGINNNQLSGVAITEAAAQSNAVVMPYIANIMQCLTTVAQTYLDLLPIYVKTPRSIPVMMQDGKKGFVKINDPENKNGIHFNFSNNPLNVSVEAGVNFQIQKDKNMNILTRVGQSFKSMDAFINEKALPIIVDNMDIRGADQLKALAEQWVEEQQQMKQQQSQQPNPLEMKMQLEKAKLQLQQQKQQADTLINASKVGIAQQEADTERERLILQVGTAAEDNAMRKEKSDTERFHAATELAIKSASQHHKHENELKSLEHNIKQSMHP